MRALVIRPGSLPRVEQVDGFGGIRQVVGGYVERITLDWSPGRRRMVQLWLDEDGLAKGLPPNLYAAGPAYLGTSVVGTVVLCIAKLVSHPEHGEDEEFIDINDEEVLRWSAALLRISELSRGGR